MAIRRDEFPGDLRGAAELLVYFIVLRGILELVSELWLLNEQVDTGYMMHDLFVGRVEVDDLRTLPCHHSVPLGFRLNQLHHGTDDTASSPRSENYSGVFG